MGNWTNSIDLIFDNNEHYFQKAKWASGCRWKQSDVWKLSLKYPIGAAIGESSRTSDAQRIRRSTSSSEEATIVKSISIDPTSKTLRGTQRKLHPVFTTRLTHYHQLDSKHEKNKKKKQKIQIQLDLNLYSIKIQLKK